jgi:hypothetical protein
MFLWKLIPAKAETLSRPSAGCRGASHLKTPLLQGIRRMRLRFLVFAFALAVAGSALSQDESRPATTWQDEMAKGIVPYRQLTVDDFQISDDASSKYAFSIRGAIDPQYHFIVKRAANGFFYANIDHWTVFSGLDKQKSYRKSSYKEMKASLQYAQAILDLNEISARRIAALKPGELPSVRGNNFEEVRAELNQKVQEFVNAKYKEAGAEIEAFVKATANGAKEKKVRGLAAEIKKRLAATPNTTVPFTEAAAPGSSPSAVPVSTASISPVSGGTPKQNRWWNSGYLAIGIFGAAIGIALLVLAAYTYYRRR